MKIGVCDDEEIIRDELMELCSKYREMNLTDLKLVGFNSGVMATHNINILIFADRVLELKQGEIVADRRK